ncbi:hypothetical protein AMATHDRAFT_55211 [Amanita thiersii Skay4041]|uniref:FAD-binding PCMH-type domain-containing protein n=1 Tax=Amanita thiersii Skay4041 TaxID=703135 RepID=A0A2A9NS18_9AGAR|nr:hypothetical protein AMATHDRAFT_55211 [Amanita thiersii Skay4041]
MSCVLTFALLLPLTLAANGGGLPSYETEITARDYSGICQILATNISPRSQVFFPVEKQYIGDITNWANSNTQLAACAVEPGTETDVAKILQILGKHRVPFAVKGGGHSPNPGFSSTRGVLIAMTRFRNVEYSAKSRRANIGAGLIWDDVYAALAPHEVSILGARVSGVGVAGFLLGGGYSWKTNQHGLAIDTVTAVRLVKPNGKISVVTRRSDPELFFGLKGGFNNFGIVTEFTMATFPQTQVWGGLITYTAAVIPRVALAVSTFCQNTNDPKASIITAFNSIPGQVLISHIMFYDAPSPPAGLFDDFLNIPSIVQDVSTRSLLSLVTAPPANITFGQRNAFNTVPILEYSSDMINAIANETMFWTRELSNKTATLLSYAIEPFLSSIPAFNKGATSAYPPDRSRVLSPFDISYSWLSGTYDNDFYLALRQSAAQLRAVAMEYGQNAVGNAAVYPNYALIGTPLKDMYGRNVPRLRALKKRVDPKNVMGLAGGWKF